MTDDVTGSKDSKEKEEQFLLHKNHLKRIDAEDGEIGAKTEKKDSLWDKCIMMVYHPPKGNDQ
jgi:hypothetical protein